jgi:hypothetical protein
MMRKNPVFIITIDTEGDNIWSCPERVTTENARYLPRFQKLTESFGFKVTYLVNYEMAHDPFFQRFGREVLKRRTGEIGLHVHPWDSPPFGESKYDRRWNHIYLYDLSDDLLHAKIDHLTNLLTDVFEIRPRSHRAGKWGFDERVARTLSDHEYLVDCSVAPGASWKKYKGIVNGRSGPDYFGFPDRPYFLNLDDIRLSGPSQLLEVPVTVKSNYSPRVDRFHHRIHDRLTGSAFRKIAGHSHSWLRPTGKNIQEMLSVVDWAVQKDFPVLEFMLHSSELMPGGSPTFKTAEQIETLYGHLASLYSHLATLGISGNTLMEYRHSMDMALKSQSNDLRMAV